MKAHRGRPQPGVTPGVRRGRANATSKSGTPRWQVPPHITRKVAYGMIGLAVAASWFLTPVPVAAGLTLLAALRLAILWRQERKEQAELQTGAVCGVK